jgi:tetratricopeptide (TPR) repeat protein
MSKTAHELTRKEMKGPDKFQAAATQAAGWAGSHGKQLAVAAVAAAALVAAVAGFLSWRESRAQKAGSLLYRALVAASGQISSVPLPNVPGPIYASDAERQKAVAEAAQQVRERFPSSRAATTAALAAADAQYRLGQWDAALGSYQAYLAAAPSDDALRFAALDGVARVHEAKGQLAEAAQAWERAAEVKAFADRAALERARVLAKAGKADDARKVLSGFAEQFKESPLRAEAVERLARLGQP